MRVMAWKGLEIMDGCSSTFPFFYFLCDKDYTIFKALLLFRFDPSVRPFKTNFFTFLTTNFCMLKLFDSSDFWYTDSYYNKVYC